MKNKVVLTTGDTEGIGLEVTSKALANIGPKKGTQFILFRSDQPQTSYLRRIKTRFNTIEFSSFSDFEKSKKNLNYKTLIDISSKEPPTEWVITATKLGLKKKIDALVTGPLSKIESHRTHKVLGHTDIFRKLTKGKHLLMYFVGRHFNVLLLTDHIPLSEVSKTLSKPYLERSFRAIEMDFLKKQILKKPIGVIGLNPHAGEGGLLGKEEKALFNPLINKFNKIYPNTFSSPIVPDVAFSKKNWKKYSFYISPYHDLGLSCFKMVHNQSEGIQVTIGLPFIRTSVDHGTGFDIAHQNKANSGSMEMAIKYAINQLNVRRKS